MSTGMQEEKVNVFAGPRARLQKIAKAAMGAVESLDVLEKLLSEKFVDKPDLSKLRWALGTDPFHSHGPNGPEMPQCVADALEGLAEKHAHLTEEELKKADEALMGVVPEEIVHVNVHTPVVSSGGAGGNNLAVSVGSSETVTTGTCTSSDLPYYGYNFGGELQPLGNVVYDKKLKVWKYELPQELLGDEPPKPKKAVRRRKKVKKAKSAFITSWEPTRRKPSKR